MRRLFAPALLALLAATGGAQSPRELVERGLKAMGGTDAVRRINSVTYDFSQVTYGLGQEETPFSPARGTVAFGRSITDYLDQRRVAWQELRPAFGGGANTKQRVVFANGVIVQETNGTAAPDVRGGALGNIQRAIRTQPDRLLLSALDNAASLTTAAPRLWRHERYPGVHYAVGVDTFDLHFDATSGLLTLVAQTVDDPILGDRVNLVAYERWQAAGDVLLPRQIDVTANGMPASQVTVHAADVNANIGDTLFNVPAEVAARSSRVVVPADPIAVQLTELSPGVWHAAGGTHNSLVVEQPTSLILIEAPLGAARMKAVFDTLARRFPGKPVLLVVATHHHWDHAGGIREVLARGIPVLGHERDAEFFRTIGRAKKTFVPDLLSRTTRVLNVRTLRDSMTIGEGAGLVKLYTIRTVHVIGLLAAYVPSAQVVFTSDVVNPAPLPAPLPVAGSRELVDFGAGHGLVVKRYAGGHGRVVAWDELEKAAARP